MQQLKKHIYLILNFVHNAVYTDPQEQLIVISVTFVFKDLIIIVHGSGHVLAKTTIVIFSYS